MKEDTIKQTFKYMMCIQLTRLIKFVRFTYLICMLFIINFTDVNFAALHTFLSDIYSYFESNFTMFSHI